MFKLFTAFVNTGPLTGQQFLVKPDATVLIGRVMEATIKLDSDLYCSRMHAMLFWDKEHCFIEDLKSSNGTFVNNKRIVGKQELKDGDSINVGGIRLKIEIKDYSKILPGSSSG